VPGAKARRTLFAVNRKMHLCCLHRSEISKLINTSQLQMLHVQSRKGVSSSPAGNLRVIFYGDHDGDGSNGDGEMVMVMVVILDR
jgi:hypothetical protein